VRGYAVEFEDRCLGVAGVAYSKPLQCFSRMTAEMKTYPRQIVQTIRLVRKLLNDFTLPIYAMPDEDEPLTADGFLRHVGFEKLYGGLYIWVQP